MTTEKEATTVVARVLNEFRSMRGHLVGAKFGGNRRLVGRQRALLVKAEAARIIGALKEAGCLRLSPKAKKTLGRSVLTGKQVLKPASKPGKITLAQARNAVRKVSRRK